MAGYPKRMLDQIEHIFSLMDYTIRYEKGNFQSGYCIVENANVVVINKFFDRNGRITALLDILSSFDVDCSDWSQDDQALYHSLPLTSVYQ